MTKDRKEKPRETLKKREILRGYGAVEEVLNSGRRFAGRYVTLFYLPAGEKKVAFLAARMYRKAVRRNRIKRLLREVYRKNKAAFPPGKWILYGRFREPAPEYDQIKQDVMEIITRVGLEKGENDQ